ncbi:MAG TPA: hypothetical protein VFV02_09935, partial [Acidimicrobiales bacterium]|nr:hypothetical protein [Acidimicrobiales bacterium]
MLFQISRRWQVRARRPGAKMQPFAAGFNELAQSLVARISPSMLVGRDDWLRRPSPQRQLGLREP